jgi:DNA anti-recombination protein RmuC
MSTEEVIQLSAEMENRSKSVLFDLTNQSMEQLTNISKQILDAKTAETSGQFEEKKKLIDQSLTNISREMKEKLETVQTLMTEINKLVPEKYGQVSTALENIAKQSDRLRETTQSLSDALTGSQERGIWGERIERGYQLCEAKDGGRGKIPPRFHFLSSQRSQGEYGR